MNYSINKKRGKPFCEYFYMPNANKYGTIRPMKRLIAYFHSSATAPSLQKVAGACRAARMRDWSVLRFDIASPSQIRDDIWYWQPDGCIVDAVKVQTDVIGLKAFARLPTVFIDCNPAFARRRVNTIVQDAASIAGAAAEELFRNDLKAYAYAAWPGRPFWSETRGKAFVKAVRNLGQGKRGRACEVRVFRPEHVFKDRKSLVKSLAEWIRGIPTPAGIFTPADAMSEHVLEAAARLGLKVPEDLMIIGTDNDEFFCENIRPMLSSVSQDFVSAGERAVEMVETLLNDPSAAPIHETFKEVRIVSRASTRRSKKHDHAATEALDLIRERAISGITAAEALGCFSCSRRLAEKRFRAAAGRSVMDEIHAVQIERAKELAVNPLTKLTAIPQMCGHRSSPYFQRLFKRLVGCTMNEYRERTRKTAEKFKGR